MRCSERGAAVARSQKREWRGSFALLSERLPTAAADERCQRTVFSWRSHRIRICLLTVARALAWLARLAVGAAMLSPAGGGRTSGPTRRPSGAHFLVGVLFCIGYRTLWPTVLALVLTATAGLEATQLLVAGRHADVADAFFSRCPVCGRVRHRPFSAETRRYTLIVKYMPRQVGKLTPIRRIVI